MRSSLTELDDGRFDVIVIGGGINGASTAQHLAAAGYSTLIVDKGDFGSGASARSSRLLHCGLRYLAPGRSIFDFVRHLPAEIMKASNENITSSTVTGLPSCHLALARSR